MKLCGPVLPCVQTILEEARPNTILIRTNGRFKKGPGPISSVRANEYPRIANKRMDKITLRGEVEYACEELGRV